MLTFLLIIRNNICDLLFILITILFMLSAPNQEILKDSVTYTYIHLAVLGISCILTLGTIHFIFSFLKDFKYIFQKMDNPLKKRRYFIWSGKTHKSTTLLLVSLYVFIYCTKILRICLSPNIRLFYRIYIVICYVGQKFTELSFVVLLTGLQEIFAKNLSSFYGIGKQFSKYI